MIIIRVGRIFKMRFGFEPSSEKHLAETIKIISIKIYYIRSQQPFWLRGPLYFKFEILQTDCTLCLGRVYRNAENPADHRNLLPVGDRCIVLYCPHRADIFNNGFVLCKDFQTLSVPRNALILLQYDVSFLFYLRTTFYRKSRTDIQMQYLFQKRCGSFMCVGQRGRGVRVFSLVQLHFVRRSSMRIKSSDPVKILWTDMKRYYSPNVQLNYKNRY